MELQLALDEISLEESLKLIENIDHLIDIIEIGTPFMMKYGMDAVRKFRETFPNKKILCDAKIMDGGSYEADLVFKAGADYVTVLGVSDEMTTREVVKSAKRNNGKVVVDMMNVENIKNKVKTLEKLEVDVIAVHTGVDQQLQGRTPLEDLREIKKYITNTSVAVAGGINIENLKNFLFYEPDIIIIGAGILKAEDSVKAAEKISRMIVGEML